MSTGSNDDAPPDWQTIELPSTQVLRRRKSLTFTFTVTVTVTVTGPRPSHQGVNELIQTVDVHVLPVSIPLPLIRLTWGPCHRQSSPIGIDHMILHSALPSNRCALSPDRRPLYRADRQ